jgi:cation diffusion facilitator CzcD-associated flavoprotein CzcO
MPEVMTSPSEPARDAGAAVVDVSAARRLPRHVRVAVIGTGFAGLGMAIRLKQAEVDFVVLERADDVGGTWRDNTYPGCACDAPSHLYSFSFAPNPDWSRTFSTQPEIRRYMRRCAEEHGVLPHIHFGHDVTEAAWDEADRVWRIDTSHGALTADVLVSAMGAINEPTRPQIPGLDSFEGKVFHSARWDHDHDLSGERVAVIGTGASAAQFIPKIQPLAAQVNVFQRTPAWILPRNDRRVSSFEQRLFRRAPITQRALRGAIYCARETYVLGFSIDQRLMKLAEGVALLHLRRQVSDPELRRKLRPRYRIGCKRIIVSDEYYPALDQPNVDVVTEAITAIGPNSVVTADGEEREVDTIILATGFRVADMPAASRVRGRAGVSLSELWDGDPNAYRGTTIAGFPNFFMLIGPNTILGHTSMVYMIESQVHYVLDCLAQMERRGAAVVDVLPEAQRAYNAKLEKQMGRTVWASGCASWYLNARGRNTTLWPGFTWRFRRTTRRFEPADHQLVPALAQHSAERAAA